MSEQIKIDNEAKVYELVNQHGVKVGEFHFNPIDAGMITRYLNALQHFEDMKKEYGEKEMNMELFVEMQERVVEELRYITGTDTVDAFFDVMGAFSIIDGQFYYEKVLKIIAGLIGKEAISKAKVMKKKMEDYAKKFKS